MATTYINTANMGTTNTYTISLWFKRSGLGTTQRLFTPFEATENDQDGIYIDSSDQLNLKKSGSGGVATSSGVFRDTSGWYHLCFQNDAGAAEYWINGVSQGTTTGFPASAAGAGRFGNKVGGSEYFDGLMSDIFYTDGTAYAPTVFGSTNATTGEWVINASPTVTYGSQGFFILKNGNSVTDQSGNGNNATTSGAGLTNTEDCPSDVFATLNPLASLPNSGVSTFTHGNTTAQGVNATYVNGGSTLQMTKGKFYCEMKYIATSSAADRIIVGITQDVSEISRINQDNGSYNTSYNNYGGAGGKNVQGSGSTYGNDWGIGDIIGIALDLDNEKLYFSINGVWQASGDPTSGPTGTGAITGFSSPSSSFSGGYFFFSGSNSNAQNNTVSWNFGNGYFGTTAISSEGTNASNIGKFEYDVPTGYTALSTKGLNA